MPEAAVAHHGDGAFASLDAERGCAGGAEAISHSGGADVERWKDREQVAANVDANVMRAELALDELHRGKDRPLRTASAERRRPTMHLAIDGGKRVRLPLLQGSSLSRCGSAIDKQVRPMALDELAYASTHYRAGVFTGHQ